MSIEARKPAGKWVENFEVIRGIINRIDGTNRDISKAIQFAKGKNNWMSILMGRGEIEFQLLNANANYLSHNSIEALAQYYPLFLLSPNSSQYGLFNGDVRNQPYINIDNENGLGRNKYNNKEGVEILNPDEYTVSCLKDQMATAISSGLEEKKVILESWKNESFFEGFNFGPMSLEFPFWKGEKGNYQKVYHSTDLNINQMMETGVFIRFGVPRVKKESIILKPGNSIPLLQTLLIGIPVESFSLFRGRNNLPFSLSVKDVGFITIKTRSKKSGGANSEEHPTVGFYPIRQVNASEWVKDNKRYFISKQKP